MHCLDPDGRTISLSRSQAALAPHKRPREAKRRPKTMMTVWATAIEIIPDVSASPHQRRAGSAHCNLQLRIRLHRRSTRSTVLCGSGRKNSFNSVRKTSTSRCHRSWRVPRNKDLASKQETPRDSELKAILFGTAPSNWNMYTLGWLPNPIEE